MYRLGQWLDAADHLEQARRLNPGSAMNHPVLADCYRALKRYEKVDELWRELREASPDAAIVAEGRIVAAASQADRGDLSGAVRIMEQGRKDPAVPREHHLREWYVLADLYDRSGDVIKARSVFRKIERVDPAFADVVRRLEELGD
jgi:tetratricopeptide (TPR) repeat protein